MLLTFLYLMHNGPLRSLFSRLLLKRRGHPSNRRVWAFARQKGFVTLSTGPQPGDQTYDLPALLYDALPTEITPQWLNLDNDEPNYFTKLLIFKLPQ